jgi:hypothetical protein
VLDPSSPSDLMFDPWTTAQGPTLRRIAKSVEGALLSAAAPTRKRQPKADMLQRHADIVSSVVANLAMLHSGGLRHRELAVSLKHNKANRYHRLGFGMLSEVLAAMVDCGLAVLRQPIPTVRRTGVRADGWLHERLTTSSVLLADIGRAEGEETIWLSARTGRNGRGEKLPSVQLDYVETAETSALRAEMGEINAFLATQRIELDGQPQPAFKLRRQFTLHSPDEQHHFDLHGRLYGGFWINLPKTQRHLLTVNGEDVVDLDFVAMFPALAYLEAGATLPSGDPYKGISGLPRAAAKVGLSALLSRSGSMQRLPKALRDIVGEERTAKRLSAAIAEQHRPISHLFGTGIGLRLMFIESRIMLASLRILMDQGIAALPVHDGLMCPVSDKLAAVAAMSAASAEVVGVALPVSLKPIWRPE